MDNNANITRIQLIDGPQVGYLNVKGDTPFPLTRAIGDIRDLSSRSGSFSKQITLTGDKNNNLLLNNYFDVNVKAGTFDINKRQRCAIIQNDVIILDNCYLRLLSVKKVQSRGEEIDDLVEYTVQVRDSIGDFFKEINNKELTDLKGFEIFNHNYTVGNIQSSFDHTWEDGYKYVLPWIETTQYDITELLPSIYAKQYWDYIHQQAGYTYEWDSLTASTTQFDKLIIPYSGDKKKLTEEYKDDVRVIAESTGATQTGLGNSNGIGVTSNIPSANVELSNEIQDNQGYYNPTTSRYTNVFPTFSPNTLEWEVTINFELIMVNQQSVNSLLTGNQVNTFSPRLRVLNNSNQVRGIRNLQFTNLSTATTVANVCQLSNNNQTVRFRGSGNLGASYNWAPGETVVATGVLTTVVSTTNIPINDELRLLIDALATQGSDSVWRISGSFDAANVFAKLKVNSARVNIVPNYDNGIIPGGPVFMDKLVPRKVKQSDFLKSIYQKYNLYVEIDPQNPNKLIYTSRDEFYDSGELKDWTGKLDKKIDQHLKFVPEISSKKLVLSYKDDDKDAVLSSYRDETTETYGQIEVTFDNENVRGIERKEEIFSPTINIPTDFFNANLPVLSADFKYNIRVLYDGGKLNCGNYTIFEFPGSTVQLNEYPFTSMVDRPENPTFDISYAQPDYYSYDIGEGTENNLYTNHWRRTLAQINSGKLLTAYFWLNEEDIQKIKLNDKIKLNNALWYINAIIDYDANAKKPTKVELLSIEDDLKLPRFGRIVKPVGPGGVSPVLPVGPVKPVGPIRPVVDAVRDIIRIRRLYSSVVGYSDADIQGNNTIIPTGFRGSVLADNTRVEEDGFYSSETTKMTNDGFFVGDNSLTLEGLKVGETTFGPSGMTYDSNYVDDFYVDDEYFESFSSSINFSGDEVELSDTVVNGSLNINNQYKFITKASDFPTPNMSGERQLLDDVTYFITGTVDLSGTTLIGGSNTTILGSSSENSILTSTGLSAGTPLIKSIYTTPIRHISINDVDTAIEFDGTTNPSEMALDWTGVNFLNVPNIGLIKESSNFIYDKGAFLNSKGLKFDGEIGTVGLNNSLFQGDGLSGNILEVLSSCTITRRFRTIYSSFVSFSSTTSVNVSTGATIPTEAYILDTINFAGGGTYIDGVTSLSNKSLFINCVGIGNTSVNGQMYMRGNAVATTITNTTDFFKVAGTTTASTENEKYTMTDNRLTNDATIQRKYLVQCTLSFGAGANNVCEFGFYDSKLGDIREPSINSTTANTGGRAENITLSCIINHSQGDYIEVWTRNTSSTANITVSEMNVIITEFK